MTREEINKRIMQACKNTWNEKVCKEIEESLKQEPKVKKVIKMRNATSEEKESIDKYIKSISATVQEPKYCDRNICISNEYNGIGCDECEVTKSQEKEKILEPTADEKTDKALDDIYKIRNEILYNDNGCYEPNDVLDIIDQISNLFEEI